MDAKTDLGRVYDSLINLNCTIDPCGSTVTCSPPPTDTDRDYLVEVHHMYSDDELLDIVPCNITDVYKVLVEEGWSIESGDYNADENSFTSWRKGDVNLIVTDSSYFAKRHHAATHVCKTLNLMEKSSRIMVFQAVLYGEIA